MTQIEKIRRKSGGYISYKFYGVKDLSAGFDVKFVIDNHDFLKNSFGSFIQEALEKKLDDELEYTRYDYKLKKRNKLKKQTSQKDIKNR